jgi:hypothetical protein
MKRIKFSTFVPKGLPFQVSRAKANEFFANDRGLLHKTIKIDPGFQMYDSDPVTASFEPFHSVDVKKLSSRFVGKYGIDHTVYYTEEEYDPTTKTTSVVQKSKTVTKWYSCSGTLKPKNYPFGVTIDTQIYAGFHLRKLKERILPSKKVVNIQPITKEMLEMNDCTEQKKILVSPHKMNMSFAMDKINSVLYRKEVRRAENYIENKYSADHSLVETLEMKLKKASIQTYSYFIPAYIYTSSVDDYTQYKIINGYSGEMVGNNIYSLWKSSVFGASIGGILTFGITAFMQPYMLLPELFMQVAVGISISGVLSGLFANFHNNSDRNHFEQDREEDKKLNDEYFESEDDIYKRNAANEINGECENKSLKDRTNISLTFSQCEILGLEFIKLETNTKAKYTFSEIKKAYILKIKRFHPDVYTGKKEEAESKTKELNNTFSEIVKSLRSD